MKTASLIALLLVSCLSCGQETISTLSGTYNGRALVARDKDIMDRIIDCGITGNCDDLAVRELLPNGDVFFVETGTRVLLNDRLTLSRARRIHVLEGPYAGTTGWVYKKDIVCTGTR